MSKHKYENIDDAKYGWDYDAGVEGINGGTVHAFVYSPIAIKPD